jgi:hypothetical protein
VLCYDASTYALRLPDLSDVECTGPLLKSLYMPVADDSNVVNSEYTHVNMSSMLMLMITQTKYLTSRIADLEDKIDRLENKHVDDSSIDLVTE